MNCEGFNELLLIVFFIKKCKERYGFTTNRKNRIMKNVIHIIFVLLLASCTHGQTENKKENHQLFEKEKVEKTETEWREILTAKEYNVLREKGTERAFSGEYNKHYEEGTYVCKACQNPLFLSENKFDSGTGWPSYFSFIGENVKEIKDYSHGMNRVEVVCGRCEGHLGHVFTDGPKPTGLRYCINSVSLLFEEEQ